MSRREQQSLGHFRNPKGEYKPAIYFCPQNDTVHWEKTRALKAIFKGILASSIWVFMSSELQWRFLFLWLQSYVASVAVLVVVVR